MFVEPLGQWREVHVIATKTASDWAGCIKWLVDHRRFDEAERMTVVCDNLITRALGSLYQRTPSRKLSESRVAERIVKWYRDRNQRRKGIDWQFTNEKARLKLKRLYPKIGLS